MNRCIRLLSRPVDAISQDNVELCVESIPALPPVDQAPTANKQSLLVVKNLYASIDPTMRIWMSEKEQYMDNLNIGDIIRAATVGVIIESNDEEEWPVGMHVVGFGGLCDYYLGIPGKNVLYPAGLNDGLPLTADLSVCSVIVGLTAWHGMNKVLAPKEDDVVVISGAAGAVGSIAGQLAKLCGSRVIGIAGGPEKCSWLTDTLGFDAAIDYKSQNIDEALRDLAPSGVSCYFDNVGGVVTDAVLMNVRNYARIAICGSISEYNDSWTGIKNFNMILMRRLSVKGFICVDHIDELAVMKKDLAGLASAGRLKYAEDVREGLENFVDVVNLLFSGKNTGKLILKINDN